MLQILFSKMCKYVTLGYKVSADSVTPPHFNNSLVCHVVIFGSFFVLEYPNVQKLTSYRVCMCIYSSYTHGKYLMIG
jgi:hypothetical protein